MSKTFITKGLNDALRRIRTVVRRLNELLTDEVAHALSLANPSVVKLGERCAESYTEGLLIKTRQLLEQSRQTWESADQDRCLSFLTELDNSQMTYGLRKEWRRASNQVVPREETEYRTMSTKDLADHFDRDRKTISRWMKNGRLKEMGIEYEKSGMPRGSYRVRWPLRLRP